MTQLCENLSETLEAVAAGRFDSVAPERMDALEIHLNECADCAGRLAEVRPEPDPSLRVDIATPSAAQWDDVWKRVAPDARPAQRPPRIRKSYPFWSTIAAVAACFVMAVVWRFGKAPADTGWDLQLAVDVEVVEVEVFGDATPFILSGDDGGSIIWVLDEPGGDA